MLVSDQLLFRGFFLLDMGKPKDFCGEELPLADNFL